MSTLIVGAGPGMGLAIARALGPAHGPVALVGRRPDVLDAMTAGLAAVGEQAQAFPADITDDVRLRTAVEAARAALGPFTVVVFNASKWVPGPPTRMSLDDFRIGLATGLTAAVVTLQATADDLRSAAPNSTLLFTGGGLATRPTAAAIGLGIQKAGLRHLTLATAEELMPAGVHVATVLIRGAISQGTAFDPDRIARVYADLASPGAGRPVEVTFTADGPDWTA